ncbi:MAG TPA: UvrD-helicase domain-containing protein, partial [Blastocatellia bacterium]|nr:UvrD-helicase domain-containing protein [Blastocatellia bacterium]
MSTNPSQSPGFNGTLNEKQIEAVESTTGPVLVLAGAGSGKTRVITQRIVHLIKQGVPPYQILAVTFTNKAAGEMKSRVDRMLGDQLRTSSPLVSTFHSFCVRMLRRDIESLNAGFTRNFTIYDEDDQSRLVRSIKKDVGIDDKSLSERQVLSPISWAKSRGISPAGYANREDHANEKTQKVARIYQLYEERLKQANAFDFDDLLIRTVDMLRNCPEVRTRYHDRFRHVMIDEFQDTNGIQYEMARLIVTNSTTQARDGRWEPDLWRDRSLFVVGDVDQSIYSWRGSDFNIILGFQHDFEGTKIIKLEQNYRSTQTILDAANHVIRENKQRMPKTLYATDEMGQGDKIRYYQSYDGEGEAAFVGEKVQEELRKSADSRCAVLYRANSQSRLFEESLRRRGIAYNILGGFSFYARAEVRDVVAYLKLALNPDDDMAFARVVNSPARGIGKTTLDSINQLQRDLGLSAWRTVPEAIKQQLITPRASRALREFVRIVESLTERVQAGEQVSDIVKAATLDTGYVRALQDEATEEAEGRLMNIEELVNAAVEAERQGEDLREFIDHAALASDTDQYKADSRVTLMTMHSAKGLEFPVVFIVGLEEGLFPHSRAAGSDAEVEEERRICYVAITRAERRLYLSHAMKRRTFGEELPSVPSRFLNEIPVELIEDLSLGPSWLKFKDNPTAYRHGAQAVFQDDSYERQGRGSSIKKTSNYTGKTYNSAESVREFFNKRMGGGAGQGAHSKDRGSGFGGRDKPAPRMEYE